MPSKPISVSAVPWHPGPRPQEVQGECYHPRPALPELWRAGWASFPKARQQGLTEHTHPGFWEISCIVHGQVDWWVEDQVYQVKRGDVYITRPDERHGGVDAVMNPCELYWLIISLPRSGHLPGMDKRLGREMVRGFEKMKSRHFPGSPELPALFERVLAEHRHPSPLSAVAARAALHQVLVTVLRDQEAHIKRLSDRLAVGSPPINDVLTWIESHFREDFDVAQLVELSGLSPTHFRVCFLRQVGQTPGEYLAQRRLIEAKRLLKSGTMSITQIAHHLSYSSSQYFATVFKRLAGLTPLEYRAHYAGPPAGDSAGPHNGRNEFSD